MSIPDLSWVLDEFCDTYSGTRTTAGPIVSGKVTSGTTQALSIRAMVVPMNPSRSDSLPEGIDVDDMRVVYTATRLYESGSAYTDTLVIDAQTFQVRSVADWHGYWIAEAERVDRP